MSGNPKEKLTQIMFKSIKTSVIVLILISTAIISKAQKVLDQGTLIYKIDYLLTEEQKGKINTDLLPSESKVKFNGNLSRLEMDMGYASIKLINDAVLRKGLMLVDVPIAQKQLAASLSKEYLDKQDGNVKFSDFKGTNEKQTIAGYPAEKFTYKDSNNGTHELWLANDLKLAKGAIPYQFAELNGTPVKYTLTQNGVTTTLTLKSVKEEKVGPFSLDVPKGYEVITVEALEAMRNGIQ